MELRELVWESVDCIHLDQIGDWRWALMNTVMNGLLDYDAMKCCSRIPTFQRSMLCPTTTLHGITTQKTSTSIFTTVKASNYTQ
jgi:hypothetical protein